MIFNARQGLRYTVHTVQLCMYYLRPSYTVVPPEDVLFRSHFSRGGGGCHCSFKARIYQTQDGLSFSKNNIKISLAKKNFD